MTLPLEKAKNEVNKIFTQTAFETLIETEVSPKHGYLSNPKKFLN